jgi:hypothetical protein
VEWPIDGDEHRTVAAVIASRGLDGSDWLIEGRRESIFRAVRVKPAQSPLRPGKLFFELAARR